MGSGASKDKAPPYSHKTTRYLEPASSTEITDVSSAFPSCTEPYGAYREPWASNGIKKTVAPDDDIKEEVDEDGLRLDCYEVARRIDYIKTELSKGRYDIDLKKLNELEDEPKEDINVQTQTDESTEPLEK